MAQTRAEKRQSVDLPSEGRMFGRKMDGHDEQHYG